MKKNLNKDSKVELLVCPEGTGKSEMQELAEKLQKPVATLPLDLRLLNNLFDIDKLTIVYAPRPSINTQLDSK